MKDMILMTRQKLDLIIKTVLNAAYRTKLLILFMFIFYHPIFIQFFFVLISDRFQFLFKILIKPNFLNNCYILFRHCSEGRTSINLIPEALPIIDQGVFDREIFVLEDS